MLLGRTYPAAQTDFKYGYFSTHIFSISLTIGSDSSSLQQAPISTTLLPLSLLNLPNNALITNPPPRWNYDKDDYVFSVYRGSGSSTIRRLNKGVSLSNWALFIGAANVELEEECQRAGLTMADQIPGRKFYYVSNLAKHHGNRKPRKLLLDIQAQGPELGLTSAAADVLLKGYTEYWQQWRTPGKGTDFVKMSRFELRAGQQTMIANGTVTLIIPPPEDNGATIEFLNALNFEQGARGGGEV